MEPGPHCSARLSHHTKHRDLLGSAKKTQMVIAEQHFKPNTSYFKSVFFPLILETDLP